MPEDPAEREGVPPTQQTPEHGTRSRYNSRSDPCRCAECTEANRAYIIQNRAGIKNPRKPPEHGTIARYCSKSYQCRCAECTEANRVYALARRAKLPRKVRPVPEHGTISRYTSKVHRCRCAECTEAARLSKVALREKRLAALAASGVPPLKKRPPGVVWIDSTEYTHVVRCERCDKNYGTWVDRWEALAFQEKHNAMHANAKETAFDWSKWPPEKLFKNPGGRPPLEDKPLCTYGDCTEDAHAKGLCMKHYKRALRGGLYE